MIASIGKAGEFIYHKDKAKAPIKETDAIAAGIVQRWLCSILFFLLPTLCKLLFRCRSDKHVASFQPLSKLFLCPTNRSPNFASRKIIKA